MFSYLFFQHGRKIFIMTEYYSPNGSENRPLSGLLSQAPERAILVGVDMPGGGWPVEESLDELAQLATSAGVLFVVRVFSRFNPAPPCTLFGSRTLHDI